MKIPTLAIGAVLGCAVAVMAPRLVATARAQTSAQAAPVGGPGWTPPVRYQYQLVQLDDLAMVGAKINSMGVEGWHFVGIDSKTVVRGVVTGGVAYFERSWPTR